MSTVANAILQLPGLDVRQNQGNAVLAVGLDIGFGYVKVVASNGRWALFPSIVEEGRELQLWSGFGNTDLLDNLIVELDGRRYFVGSLALRETDAELDVDPNKIFNIDFDILVYTALHLVSEQADQAVNVFLGLPVNFYRTQKARFEEKLKARQASCFVKIAGSDVRLVKIRKYQIFPQAGGALFNQILDFRSEVKSPRLARGKIGVIDSGTKTTDCIFMDDLKFVDQRSFSINDGGTHKILIEIREFLMKNFDNYYPRLAEVDLMLRERRVEIRGKVYDLSPVINPAAIRVARKILREVYAKWPNRMEIRAIILAGGGGLAMEAFFKEAFPNLLVACEDLKPEPPANDWRPAQFANALGFLKLACMRYGDA
ncbi:MAG: ParM/StbA family protein [Heliobacteriaceae bacterium]|nr:ParM/StbA family protein [Heliobacteriaceae bacterium]MDD4587905.1 ParM/StbA family protein [Heliobacteriaceae bacterium]